jgi:hypothetical protein
MSRNEEDTYELDQMRVRNRLLSSRLKKSQRVADENFAALCELSPAQAALYQIWESSDLDCEPQDYDTIVDFAVTAITEYRVSQVSKQGQY